MRSGLPSLISPEGASRERGEARAEAEAGGEAGAGAQLRRGEAREEGRHEEVDGVEDPRHLAGQLVTVDERIAELAAAAPPLTGEQRAHLASLFRQQAIEEQDRLARSA